MEGGFLEKTTGMDGIGDVQHDVITSGGEEGLLRDAEVCGLLMLWIAVWVIAHCIAWPLWNYLLCKGTGSLSSPVDRYRRRLCRSQAYCSVCVVGAVVLFSRCRSFPHDLLYDFSITHQVLFTMATGHWLVSIWEDARSPSFLVAGLTERDLPRVNNGDGSDVSIFLLYAYVVHHLAAAACFAVVTFLRACTAVASFGLLFELPVLFLNHREFLVLAGSPPSWWLEESGVRAFWTCIYVTYVIGRFLPVAVYIYSLFAWRDDLFSLSLIQTITYHGMALFFAMLSYQFYGTFMQAWNRHDLRRVGALDAAHWDAREKERIATIDESVKPLMRVTQALLEGKDGSDGSYWLEIDGIAYNVTEFLEKHPGGPAVLKRFAGKDASMAFHKIGHSQRAQIQMHGMSVGPVGRAPDQYRIFEHPDELGHTLWEAFSCASTYGLALLLMGNSSLPSLGSHPQQEGILHALLPGFIISVGSALGVAVMLTCALQWGTLRPSGSILGWGLFMNMHVAGLALARRALPTELLQRGCPTGLELAAVALWLVEELLEGCSLGNNSMLAVAALVLSWHFRGIEGLHQAAPEHFLSAALIALSTPWMMRRVAEVNGSRSRRDVVAEFFGGLLAAGLVGACGLCWLAPPDVPKAELLNLVGSFSASDLAFIAVACASCASAVANLLNAAHLCSPAWAVRCLACTFAMAAIVAGCFLEWRWLMFLACVLHLTQLASRNRAYLDAAGRSGAFGQVCVHNLGTQMMWDHFRTFVLTTFWRTTVMPIRRMVHWMLPQELTVFAMEIPVFDLGDDVDLGLAAHFQPAAVHGQRDGEGDRDKPGYFVCNVGHIDNTHQGGLSDMQRTMNALRDVWSEFKKPDVKGLISNIVCVFPTTKSNLTKEINLSTWTSSREVHEWYKHSQAHRKIMTQNNSGYLRTFGSLLASMTPVREVRHQDRCTRCARVVESDRPGMRAPSRCNHCGARTFGYPFV